MQRQIKWLARVALGLCMVASLAAQQSGTPPVTYQDLLNGLKEPSRWLTYFGDYTGQRHSPLKQITPDNVNRLTPQWTFQTDQAAPRRGLEATPLVIDGVLYMTGINNYAWAIDARTGRQIWRFRYEFPADHTQCCGPVNRGFGVLGDRLFMTTLDAHLLAIDMKTGNLIYDVVLADYKAGHAATMAPLVVKDKVIVGISGGERGIRGFVDAYDAQTGNRVWRFYTVPAPGEPGSETWSAGWERGGGGAWQTPTYDPELNLIFFGTGNPWPAYVGDGRKGDNLYTDSLLALDADTGKMRWYYQFTPHDLFDWDSNQIPVLADVAVGGQQRKVVMFANRNAFFYAFDRADGTVIFGKPFAKTSWAEQLGRDGRPIILNPDGSNGCLTDIWGATNAMPPSFDPALRLFFVTARETCVFFTPTGRKLSDEPRTGALRAIDATTGQRRWEFPYPTPGMSGVMSTASGLVFTGDNEGNFIALESRTGKPLWHYQMGSVIWQAAPTTYMLDGRQWITVPAGQTLTAFALPSVPAR